MSNYALAGVMVFCAAAVVMTVAVHVAVRVMDALANALGGGDTGRTPRRNVRVITQEYPDMTRANYSADIRGDAAASDWTAETPPHLTSGTAQHVFRARNPRELAARIRRAGDTRNTIGWVVDWCDDIHHTHEQDVRPAREGEDIQPW